MFWAIFFFCRGSDQNRTLPGGYSKVLQKCQARPGALIAVYEAIQPASFQCLRGPHWRGQGKNEAIRKSLQKRYAAILRQCQGGTGSCLSLSETASGIIVCGLRESGKITVRKVRRGRRRASCNFKKLTAQIALACTQEL